MARNTNNAQARRMAAAIREKKASSARNLSTINQRYLDRFSANMTPAQHRQAVREAVQQICQRADHISGSDSFRRIVSDVCALATWAVTNDVDTSFAVLMDHAVIHRFGRSRTTRQSETGQALRVKRLKNLASDINPGPCAPPRLVVSGHRPTRPPCTPTQEAAIIRIASNQRHPVLRKRLLLAIGLARGAGASPNDIRRLLRSDIDDRGDGGIFVTLGQGAKQRTVPVRREYEHLLREGLPVASPDSPVLGDAKNAVNRLLQSAEHLSTDLPDLDLRRLRTAWIAHLMTEPIPLSTLLKAAGLQGPRTIADLYSHLATTTGVAIATPGATEALRGAQR